MLLTSTRVRDEGVRARAAGVSSPPVSGRTTRKSASGMMMRCSALRPPAPRILADGVGIARHGGGDDIGEQVTWFGVPLNTGPHHVAKHAGGNRVVAVRVGPSA
jgi:hypothetical protein